LYHFHDPELLPIGVLLKLTTGARVIYDVHENHAQKILSREWLPRPLRRVASLGARLAEVASVPFFDGIVPVTEDIAAQFSHPRTVIVKNYPLLEKLTHEGSDQQGQRDESALLYTGGLTRHRGAAQIIQAMAFVQTSRAELIILGRSEDPESEARMRAFPGFRRVDYRGAVPFEEVYHQMRSSAIGLVCNQPGYDYELAQPNKLFEYMSAGLPVIASDFDLWREVVEGNNCGVTVDPTSPQDIANAVDYLLTRPDLRRQMGENGRRAVLESYNWRTESQKLLRLYEELLN
jgi:glycosyltransferase involved in cell wall biosynthesis